MKMLDVDKNMKLDIPELYPGIIRTGTISEGSCFFHSVMKGLNPYDEKTENYYSNMDEDDKLTFMEDLRAKISDSITLEYYKTLLFNISSLRLSQKLSKFLNIIYNFIENPEEFLKKDKYNDFLTDLINSNLVVFKMLVAVLSEEEFVSVISTSRVTSSHSIDQYIENLDSELYNLFIKNVRDTGAEISKERLDICKTKIRKFVYSICNAIIDKQYIEYKRELKSTNEWASDYMFGIVADYLNLDIYFINENTKDVMSYDHVSKGNRQSIVVGWINGNHFESIGIYESTSGISPCELSQRERSFSGRKEVTIKRLFDPDHPFIVRLREEIDKSRFTRLRPEEREYNGVSRDASFSRVPSQRASPVQGKEDDLVTYLKTLPEFTEFKDKPKTVLITTGSFNPVHKTHIRMAGYAWNKLNNDKNFTDKYGKVEAVVFSPSSEVYLNKKVGKDNALSGDARLELLDLGIKDFKKEKPGVKLFSDSWEINQPDFVDFPDVMEHYDYVLKFNNKINVNLMYLCGADHFVKNIGLDRPLLEKYKVIIINRVDKDHPYGVFEKDEKLKYNCIINITEEDTKDDEYDPSASSTNVRKAFLIKDNETLNKLLFPSVLKYMKEKNMFSK